MSTYGQTILLVTSDEAMAAFVANSFQQQIAVDCLANPADAASYLHDKRPLAVLFDVPRNVDLRVIESLIGVLGTRPLWLLLPLGDGTCKKLLLEPGVHSVVKPVQRSDIENILDHVWTRTESSAPAPSSTTPVPAHCNARGRAAVIPILESLPEDKYFFANCSAMLKVYETALTLAPVDVPILIQGESGVGKDILAALLHKHSLRNHAPFIRVNCAALPSELLESELFGYEPGAFTGATRAKPGKFELAQGGTILLDEIGEMDVRMQAKLLHVLQDGLLSRLGSRTSQRVDVRVIAATNVDIERAIEQGRFREDLYYRISTFTIKVPPLRERRSELSFLAEQILRNHTTKLGRRECIISPRLQSALQAYSWPGNLRELSNVLMRLAVLQDEDLLLQDLEDKVRVRAAQHQEPEEPSATDGMRSIMRQYKTQAESRLIQDALDEAGWNRRNAAAQLQISYRALLYKIQEYGLHPPLRRAHMIRQTRLKGHSEQV